MKEKIQTNKRVRSIRSFRKYHRFFGLIMAVFLLISAVTGLLLGWKKDAAWIQPPTQKGTKDLTEWLDIHELGALAQSALAEAHPDQADNNIDRLDVRPGKGIVKVLFENGYWEVQIDGNSGAVLSINKRYSDFIEHLHDGSIISDTFKLASMNVLGVSLMIMIISGIWLWYGPRLIRAKKRHPRKS